MYGCGLAPLHARQPRGVLDIHLLRLPDHLSYMAMPTGTIKGWYSEAYRDHYALRGRFGSRNKLHTNTIVILHGSGAWHQILDLSLVLRS